MSDAANQRHWTMLIIGLVVVLAPYLLRTTGSAEVKLFAVSGPSLPELCNSRALFGVSCPGCGLTRSVTHLAHGRFGQSFRMHRLGWLLYLAAAFQIPHRILLLRGYHGLLGQRLSSLFGKLLIAALILCWLYEQSLHL